MKNKSLDDLVEEATIDCYDDWECLSGFAATLEDKLKFPFKAKLIGEEVEVVGVDQNDKQVLAICRRNGKKYPVDILSLKVDPKSVTGYEWLEAFRKWSHV